MARLMVGFSMVAGCATSTEVRGSALVGARTAKVFATGPAVVHACSLDRGGVVFLAPAITGTDADCAGGQNERAAHGTTVAVDRRNVVQVPVGDVACFTADRARPYELMWRARHSRHPTPSGAEIAPGREQASLGCARALRASASTRSLLVSIDRDDVALVLAAGNQPLFTWRINVVPKQLLPREELRVRVRRALEDARVPRLCASVQQIVVSATGTALARSVLLDALVTQLGNVAIRRTESLVHA